jgi:hypothetical protein
MAASSCRFAAIYKDLKTASAVVKGKADIFVETFTENLADLLSYQVPNTFIVTYHGKPLKSHSLGQRASAMMLFLLSQDDHDLLLIDQPEDDLDSQTVYEEVVKLVRGIKKGRQFIFATHNANFPVLGDAEIVAACAYEETISVVIVDARVTNNKISDVVKSLARVTEAISANVLYAGGRLNALMATAQYDQFEKLEIPIMSAEQKERAFELWHELSDERDSYLDGVDEDLIGAALPSISTVHEGQGD